MARIKKLGVRWTPRGHLRIQTRSGYTFLHPDEIVDLASMLIDALEEANNNRPTGHN